MHAIMAMKEEVINLWESGGGSMKGFLRKEKRRTVIITSKVITIKEK